MTEPAALKQTLRQIYLERRMRISPDLRQELAKSACDVFFQNVKVPDGAVVAGYWPIRAEMDDLPILKKLLRQGHACALPCVTEEGNSLKFCLWDETAEMKAGKYGISEPASGKETVPDVLIVPLLAFDTECHRLGYGAGFYDRTIRGRAPVLTIGLAYEDQLCEKLPIAEHDVRMDMIVTDRNIYK